MSSDTNSVCCHLANRDITAEMKNDNIILTDQKGDKELSEIIHIDYVNKKAVPVFTDVRNIEGVDFSSTSSLYVALDKWLDEFEFFCFQDNAKTIQYDIAI